MLARHATMMKHGGSEKGAGGFRVGRARRQRVTAFPGHGVPFRFLWRMVDDAVLGWPSCGVTSLVLSVTKSVVIPMTGSAAPTDLPLGMFASEDGFSLPAVSRTVQLSPGSAMPAAAASWATTCDLVPPRGLMSNNVPEGGMRAAGTRGEVTPFA
eukprot:CAMPEP_0171059416 /NCGR_PEP_ID=MMETSP0766_2-20121228/3164_1 /TAXON_ID=439317 /ORGANISM="Gambierdiscus australes, Strain CAWD 149" /LENGTH=154 /DNA_ID=CAMNT_0011514849 /DNA_START=43 /DNA_END=508 /DNA_ORIENTATION=+